MLSYFANDINQITTTSKKINFGVKQIATDEKNRIWIFYWLADSEIYDAETGLTDADFFSVHHSHSMVSKRGNALFIDKEGNYWISTGNGIGIYNDANQYYKIHQVNVEDKGIEQDPLKIKAMAQTDRDHIWLATNLGLYKYNLAVGVFQHVKLKTEITNITTLCADSHLLWIGIYDQLLGLDTESETIVKKYKTDPGIFFIQKGDHGDLWVGLWTGGLCRVNVHTDEIEYFKKNKTVPATIQSNNLIAGMPDRNAIWIGYNAGNGFSKYSILSDTFIHFHPMERDSTSSNAGTITVITKDSTGDLWLGTHGSGIFRFDPDMNTYVNYQQQQGLNSNYINSILPDAKGNLWISTADGINYFNAENASIRKLAIDMIFSDNDFAANGISGLEGKLYFFCNNKFVEVDPKAFHPDQKFPHLVLGRFKIFDQEFPVSAQQGKINLSYRQNYFSFEYSAIRTNPLKEIHTAHMLEGFDKSWNISTNHQYAGYTNVPYGNYRFNIKASNEEGQWSETLLSMAVHIKPPFWSTWWFAMICVAVVVMGIYVLYRNRVRQIKRIFSLRNKISQDLHDDVGASLSSIQIYSAVAEKEMKHNPDKAKEIVQQINQNSRQVMENMSDIVWAIHSVPREGETLAGRIKNYGYDLLSQKNIECKYMIEANAEKKLQKPEARKNVLLIVKEALNNIAKYSDASQTQVQISIESPDLFVRISDNGKGFEVTETHNGNGLYNMKQRAEALGGRFSVVSTKEEGTSVQCRIPLANISDR
jgi:frataxin-like iron-binding protein CyaY